jgi:cation transport regulator ChaB
MLLFTFHGDFQRVQLEKMRTNLNNNFLFSNRKNRKNKNKRRRNKRRRRIRLHGVASKAVVPLPPW